MRKFEALEDGGLNLIAWERERERERRNGYCRLLTNVERVHRHVATSGLCEICNNGQEDIEHVLRSCTMAKGVWTRMLPRERWESFFGLSFPEWLRMNLFDTSFYVEDGEWGVRVAITCWLLWKRRCRLLFAPGDGLMEDVLSRGGRLVEECSRASNAARGTQPGRVRTSTWSKPRVGWVKLNVDASVSTVDRSAGVGGVIRDNQGKWLFGLARFVGRYEVLLAELWAIHDGLLHACDLGYRCVEVESDCLDAVKIATARSTILAGSALVCSILRMLRKDWSVVVTHVDRGSNGVAGALARRGRGSSLVQVSLSEAPDEVALLWKVSSWFCLSLLRRLLLMSARCLLIQEDLVEIGVGHMSRFGFGPGVVVLTVFIMLSYSLV
ncbi:hypothetical protein GQ457_03G030660 [Hibiscus cannabinus]